MKKRLIIIVLIIILILICIFGVKLIKNKKDNDANQDLYSIVGLTINGHKRVNEDECVNCSVEEKENTKNGNYVLYNEFSLINFFISLDNDKEIIIKDLPKEKIKELIYKYAIENDLLSVDVLIDDGDDDSFLNYACIKESGICDGIKINDYNNIIVKYDLSENASDYYDKNEIFKYYYLYEPDGRNDILAEINDKLEEHKDKNDIILNYSIELKYDNNNINKELTFRFKKKNNNNYLYSVIVNNK